ncbi:HAD family hydrolase [Thermosynechococcus sp. QKsg1]|uniref:HAD-IA family hydrolase n=1 Tax=unclassified Thermosynechococcus TaxID=2622553 RepID=UPI00122E5367|nr:MULTISPECIES: HAD family hydrolase [unclassified Thermosynechococcus]QEQ02115.1 HAD family hydrolase [Thermosynechococcus sp. CL-1]WJI26521.1 HAD family hydrolase [Thermosynechococcus sp. B1]WJI29047.1 HAD family hydrolase [Thermosynechococcus sp. B3]WKT83638.1 HAD family hydrolase [Thermosynechococcus sp. HY596]WNC62769.1 HAD family hydrolase [Thermosynechococcus sp. HY591]
MPPLDPPQLITLDAVGTLFGLRESVGTVYGRFAAEVGVQVDSAALDVAFFKAFRAAPPCAFPDLEAAQRAEAELRWWQGVAAETFRRAGVLDQFADFDRFFAPVFAYYATAEPWLLYSDVLPALKEWQAQGIPLMVVSNFDSRLYGVLEALGLAPFFKEVWISSEVGAAKPNRLIFERAVTPYATSQVWHIGDSWEDDVLGAQGAGLQAIWLRRDRPLLPEPAIHETRAVPQIADLSKAQVILRGIAS